MSILGCWAEDIDFPNGSTVSVSTSSTDFRSGYGRCSVAASGVGNTIKSTPIASAVTSCWVSFQARVGNSTTGTARRGYGVCRSGGERGLFVGVSATGTNRLALFTWDGTTLTQLAIEGGASLTNSAQLVRIDIQIVNFGATSTVNVYFGGVLVIAFSGSSAISGISDLNSFYVHNDSSNFITEASEVIFADEDTRLMSLCTMAPNANGTTQNWTANTFSNVNATTVTDATPVFVNTAGQDCQENLSDLPSGTFAIRTVKITARAGSPGGSTATQVGLGVRNGSGIDAGTPQAPGTSYTTLERLMAQDPTTSADWALADMNGLQLNLRSS